MVKNNCQSTLLLESYKDLNKETRWLKIGTLVSEFDKEVAPILQKSLGQSQDRPPYQISPLKSKTR